MKSSQHQIGTLKFDRLQYVNFTVWNKCKMWKFRLKSQLHYVNSVHEHITAADSNLQASHHQASLKHESQ